MKQIITPPVRPRTPSVASQLQELKVGEQARLELVGRSLSHYLESRSRLRGRSLGDWTHEFTDDGRALIITRTA